MFEAGQISNILEHTFLLFSYMLCDVFLVWPGHLTMIDALSNASPNEVRCCMLTQHISFGPGVSPFSTAFVASLNSGLLFVTHCSNFQNHCTVYHHSSNFSRNFRLTYAVRAYAQFLIIRMSGILILAQLRCTV